MNIDLIIIIIFLAITLSIGFYCGTGITTFQDYAVGNKKMRSFVIAISLIATSYGGRSLTYGMDICYQSGLYYLISNIVHIAGLYVTSRFIVLRMKAFIGHLSIVESMGSLYGSTIRVITGIFGILFSTFVIVAQLKFGLSITKALYPEIEQFSPYLAIILALLVIGYATFGGARSVALTDVYEFFLFGICFPILIFMCLYYVKNPLANWAKLTTAPHFNISNVCTLNNILTCISIAPFWASLSIFDPRCLQRFYMASSTQKAVKAFYKGIIIEAILVILFFTIAVAAHLGNYEIPTSQHVIDYLIQLVYFPGMRGILVTAIIALLMSTADSSLHTSAVLFTNDIALPITGRSAKKVNKYPLRTARIASACIGIVSILMISYQIDFSKLSEIAGRYYLTFTIPLIMASFGFRPHSTAVLLNMGINMFIPFILKQSIAEAFYCNLFILITTHYLLPKSANTGWVGIKDLSPLDLQNQETKRWWCRRLQGCKQPFTKAYWKNFFPKKERTFILLGIYIILHTFTALYFMQKDYFSRYTYWYILVIAFGTILMIYPSLHSYKPKGSLIFHWAWPVLLFALLFVSGIQFAKLGHFKPMVFAFFIASLALGIVLFSLKVGLSMLGIAMFLHKFIPPSMDFWSTFLTNCNQISVELILATALVAAALVGSGTYKYLRDKIETKLKIIALARHFERKAALEAIYNQVNWSRLNPIYSNKMLQEMRETLQKPCHYLYTNGQPKLGETINLFMKQLHKFSKILLKRVKEEQTLTLSKKAVQQIEIDSAILQAHSMILALEKPIALLVRNQTKVTHLMADRTLFERLLTVNLFGISKSEQATDHMVTLTIANTVLRYDYESAVQSGQTALTLPALAFCMSTDAAMQNIQLVYDITDEAAYTHLPKSENHLYQAESRQIVQAHGGYATILDTQSVLTYCYVLPIAGQKVMRFKTYDPTVLNHKISETAESVAQEQELTELLIAETALTKATVEKTIHFIKNAHGLVTRKSGAPYYTHPMEVAKILLEVTKDPTTILAALLHDVVEDTPIPLTQVELMYGHEVAYIVDMVTHYNTNGYRWKLDDKENKNLLGQCKDIRVVQVKLADRLHNIRTLHFRKLVDQKRIAKETIAFYIPWGKKNKISNWVLEMSDICEEILNKKDTSPDDSTKFIL
ncbi:sodium:solute symporter family transporter [Cardinium endosymbiont of Nabis limbatus]|uniref:sodium:solute symporter family protein n=1 Tax=Cardinium endosymbiont of Nabis limbatus TaxID=3066217 RepID=UPI003AF3312D